MVTTFKVKLGEFMFKHISTRIFLGFASLILISLAVLTFLFARASLRETETFTLEALSKKSQIRALQFSHSLAQGKTISQATKEVDITLVDKDGKSIPKNPATPFLFSSETIKSFLPPTGSIVTECSDRTGSQFFCALSYVPEIQSWIFDSVPRSSALQVLAQLKREIFFSAIVLLVLALVFAFVLSNFLLNSLAKFADASARVAKGEYHLVKLPIEARDEIGDFARAFQKMIIDLRDREANLAASAVKLAHSARLASIGQMGASIAHEVKNPLTSMMGYAKILHSKVNQNELKEAVEIILKESERCNQILQQMLRFARNDPQERKPYALKEVLDSAVLLMKAEAKRRQIELKLECHSDGIVIGSAQQMQQVLINLILNAIQASPAGAAVITRATESDGVVLVEVEDHGPGIPAEVRSKIFEPFFTTKEKREGTGLGLSVASEIVSDQGGQLDFESTEGKGAVFRVRLPIAS